MERPPVVLAVDDAVEPGVVEPVQVPLVPVLADDERRQGAELASGPYPSPTSWMRSSSKPEISMTIWARLATSP